MKKLNFYDHLPDLILKGEKTATWRINDDKDLCQGGELSLQRPTGSDRRSGEKVEFARAEVVEVKKTRFGDLTEEDFVGHEPFSSTEEMYRVYSDYYGFSVGEGTVVKIVRFRLVGGD